MTVGGNTYDNPRYGIVHRKWFGLSAKAGGYGTAIYGGATGVTVFVGTTDATSGTLVERWYPGRGPIKMLKAGCLVLATLTNASNDLIPVYVKTRGASASAACSFYMKSTSSAVAPWTIASTTSFTVSQCKAGEYVSVRFGTPRTDKATAANTASTTGTIALFIDYQQTFATEWDPKSW